MLKCLIWGNGRTFYQYFCSIKYHEMLKEIEIVGVTSNTAIFDSIMGYHYFDKMSVTDLLFDVVIVMADDNLFQEIKKEVVELGIDKKKIISYKVLTIPNLDIKKYMEIVNNNVTIFANNCWGGLVYNKLGLEFASPFINMFELDNDYIKFLYNPRKYINTSLVLKEEIFSSDIQGYYPVCQCDDIFLYFNHYRSFEEANNSWEKRKKRINWENLFVMMYTENKEVAYEFTNLPYEKKICFVPFKTDRKSLFYFDFCKNMDLSKLPFYQIVNSSIYGLYGCYDVLELLYSGKIIKIAQ